MIGMLLLTVTFLTAQAVDLFETGFEDATWPPTGWLMNGVYQVSATTTNDPSGNVEPTEPYEGNYCAGMSSAPENYLISPLKNNPGMYYFFVHKKDTGNYQFIIEFQAEDAVPGVNLAGSWTFIGEYWAHLGWWDPLTIDLRGYAPGYIKIRPTPPPPTPLKYMYFDKYMPVVPVELSSFTASLVQENEQNLVQLRWTTQTETQVAGYNILRNNEPTASNALQINSSMIGATNTSLTSNYSFTDEEVQPGTCYYWLQSSDLNGDIQMFGPISITIGGNQQVTPGAGFLTTLKNIYPNPFRAYDLKVTIPFATSTKGTVKLDMYNEKGQLVWSYAKNNAEAGMYQVDWYGHDLSGRKLPAGVYFCRMSSGDYLGTKKITLIK